MKKKILKSLRFPIGQPLGQLGGCRKSQGFFFLGKEVRKLEIDGKGKSLSQRGVRTEALSEQRRMIERKLAIPIIENRVFQNKRKGGEEMENLEIWFGIVFLGAWIIGRLIEIFFLED